MDGFLRSLDHDLVQATMLLTERVVRAVVVVVLMACVVASLRR